MSGWLAGRVWQSALPADLKPIAAALADLGNDDGTNIYPSIAYLVWLTGRSERTIRGWLSQLRSLGVLMIVGEVTDPKKLGRGYGVEYDLVVDRLPLRDAWKGKRTVHRKPAKYAGLLTHQKSANTTELSGEALQSTAESSAIDREEALQSTSLWEGLSINDPSVDPSENESAPALSPDGLMALYNQHRGVLPECLKLTPTRRSAARARTLEQPDPSIWVTVIKTLAADPGCQGQNKTGWKASFEYLLRPETWLKVMEGHLTRTPQAGRPQTANQHRQQIRDANVEHVAAGDFNFLDDKGGS